MATRRRRIPGPALADALVVGMLAATACGLPHATLGPVAGGSGQQSLPVCMRSHGITDFPDSSNGNMQFQNRNGVWTINGATLKESAAQIQAATSACRAAEGAGANSGPPDPAVQQAALAFARCMRSHGVPKFPDPKVTGNGFFGFQIKPGDGVDPNSTQFKQAQATCQPAMTSALNATRTSQGANG